MSTGKDFVGVGPSGTRTRQAPPAGRSSPRSVDAHRIVAGLQASTSAPTTRRSLRTWSASQTPIARRRSYWSSVSSCSLPGWACSAERAGPRGGHRGRVPGGSGPRLVPDLAHPKCGGISLIIDLTLLFALTVSGREVRLK